MKKYFLVGDIKFTGLLLIIILLLISAFTGLRCYEAPSRTQAYIIGNAIGYFLAFSVVHLLINILLPALVLGLIPTLILKFLGKKDLVNKFIVIVTILSLIFSAIYFLMYWVNPFGNLIC